jgi:hypothetical protein
MKKIFLSVTFFMLAFANQALMPMDDGNMPVNYYVESANYEQAPVIKISPNANQVIEDTQNQEDLSLNSVFEQPEENIFFIEDGGNLYQYEVTDEREIIYVYIGEECVSFGTIVEFLRENEGGIFSEEINLGSFQNQNADILNELEWMNPWECLMVGTVVKYEKNELASSEYSQFGGQVL